MICRHPSAVMAAAVAAALGLTASGAPARADALSSPAPAAQDYVLTTTQDLPSSADKGSGPLVIYEAPAGSIVAPMDPTTFRTSSPVTPVTAPYVAPDGKTYATDPLYTTSKDVFVFTRPTVSADGTPVEELGFAFRNGLSHNSAFVYTLNVADPSHPPTLHSLTPGVPDYPMPAPAAQAAPAKTSIAALGTPAPAGVAPAAVVTPAVAPVPEPMSLALWSVLTVAGVLRARSYRRRDV